MIGDLNVNYSGSAEFLVRGLYAKAPKNRPAASPAEQAMEAADHLFALRVADEAEKLRVRDEARRVEAARKAPPVATSTPNT